MNDIRKVGVSLIIILVVLYGGIYFKTIPAHALIRMHISPYQPDIIYLGRENRLEHNGFPTDMEDPGPQHIYALVRDTYNQELHGNLAYAAFNNTNNRKIFSGTTPMTLIDGTLTNGTWSGEIPKPKENVPYTVLYNVAFKDILNYYVNQSGPYYNYNDYAGSDYSFVNRHGYNVMYRYIAVGQNQGIVQNTRGFNAVVSDNLTNLPYEVTLYYKLNNNKSYHTTMKPTVDSTTNKPYPVNYTSSCVIHKPYPVNYTSSCVIHKYYSTSLTLPPHTRVKQFYSTLNDSRQTFEF